LEGDASKIAFGGFCASGCGHLVGYAILRKSLANSALGFFGVKRTNSSGSDVGVGFLSHSL
jgi:hypothetical protein